MAQIFPEDIDAAARAGWARAEVATLRRLERELPDEYTVYHGVHWARSTERAAFYGEIDFIVANRYGRLIAIEQKTGEVEVRGEDLTKTYGDGRPKRLRAQVSRNIQNLMSEFGRRHPGQRLDIDHLFYVPDCRISGSLVAAIDPNRVVDADTAQHLSARIIELFEARLQPTSPRESGGAPPPDALDVHAFLSDCIDVVPCVDSLSAASRERATRMASGLATWASRLSLSPYRLRVVGTAGSGKTQLALRELRAAHAEGKTAMYVCFNRSLADAMRRLAPAPGTCNTFHELAAKVVRQRGESIDWQSGDVFARLEGAWIDASEAMRETLDLLVIDEGQDFEPAWAAALLPLVKPDGRAIWLEDPSQNLYRRPRVELPGWAELRSPVNYRSPEVLVSIMNALGLTDEPLEAGGAVHGFDPRIHSCPDATAQLERTGAAVERMLAEGHRSGDIAVISWRGLATSLVMQQEWIGSRKTRRFTGQYTDDGEPIFTDGTLAVETLRRFKGQAADCIVLTEVDFEEWNDDVRRCLFVGMTRARMKLELVATERAAEEICRRLE